MPALGKLDAFIQRGLENLPHGRRLKRLIGENSDDQN